MDSRARVESVFSWQINKINTRGSWWGNILTHSNLTTQKLIKEKINSFHITNRIFIVNKSWMASFEVS